MCQKLLQQTILVQVIAEDVVTCFFETQCMSVAERDRDGTSKASASAPPGGTQTQCMNVAERDRDGTSKASPTAPPGGTQSSSA